MSRCIILQTLSVIAVILLVCCDLATVRIPFAPTGNQEPIGQARTGTGPVLSAWITTHDLNQTLLQTVPTLGVSQAFDANIRILPQQTYQRFIGVGGSVTDSSAFLIQRLPQTQKKALLSALFDPNQGIGLSFLRQPMGATDFTSTGDYSYDDNPPGNWDADLAAFSLAQDVNAIIPVLQDIVALNPNIFIMASPWSPPGWMKNNLSMKGTSSGSQTSTLKTNAASSWATYFVKFVQGYQSYGLRVQSVSIQNEPLHGDAAYPSMGISEEQAISLIRDSLVPALQQANLSVLIWGYDHNWDHTDYPIALLQDTTVSDALEGTAFHCYGGEVQDMNTVHAMFPNKSLYITECSGTSAQANALSDTIDVMINGANNWARVIALWNLALDENNGPTNNGCLTCRGIVTIDSKTNAITYNIDYYMLAHMSQFVQQNAVRVGVASSANLNVTGFVNPDGNHVLVAHNAQTQSLRVQIQGETKSFYLDIPADSAMTVVWTP